METNHLHLRRVAPILGLLFAITCCWQVQAGQSTFVGLNTANGNWNSTANWQSGTRPAEGDDIIFATEAQTTCTMSSQANTVTNFNSLTFAAPAVFLGTTSFTFAATADKYVVLTNMFGTDPSYITVNSDVTNVMQCNVRVVMTGDLSITNNGSTNLNFNADSRYVDRYSLTNGGYQLTLQGPGNFDFQQFAIIKGSGGLVKNSSGTLTLQATNTYTGDTTINAGRATIYTYHAGGGAFTFADNTTMGTTVGDVGTTLNISTLTLGNSTTNAFTLGTLGNPTAPIVTANTLTLNGSSHFVTVSGAGLSPGQFRLIKYNTQNGTGTGASFVFAETNFLPLGIEGYVSNNVAGKSIDLVITSAPVLLWTAQADNLWDINTTMNWSNLTAGGPDVFANGLSVVFDDTAASKTVVIASNVSPFMMEVGASSDYTFTNTPGTNYNITGAGPRLVKTGSGTLFLGLTNNYSGFTYISNGVVKLTVGEGIGNNSRVTNNAVLDLAGFGETVGGLNGTGLVTNSAATAGTTNIFTVGSGNSDGTFSGPIDQGPGILRLGKAGTGTQVFTGKTRYTGGTTFAGAGKVVVGDNFDFGPGSITWTGNTRLTPQANPRTIPNVLVFAANSSHGDPGAGALTYTGPIDFDGGTRDASFFSEVTWLNNPAITNGNFNQRAGHGTWRIAGVSFTNASHMPILGGTTILDNSTWDHTTYEVRIRGTNTTAPTVLRVLGNATLIVSSNLQIGYTTYAAGATNVMDVSGTLYVSRNINLGQLCDGAILNALPGSDITATAIRKVWANDAYYTEANFDDATVHSIADDGQFIGGTALSNQFSLCNLKAGGLTINTTNTLTVPQPLSGVGGLTKTGNGVLRLTGTNTYSGLTHVSQGTLRMPGYHAGSGAVTMEDGATLELSATDTNTVNISSLYLNSLSGGSNYITVLMNVTRNPNIPLIKASSLLMGAGKTVINVSAATLEYPVTYKLIDYTGSVVPGSFVLGTLSPGLVATLNDTGSSIELVVTFSLGSLVWQGSFSTWDTTSLNWTNPLGVSVAYQEYTTGLAAGLGDVVTFNDDLYAFGGSTTIEIPTAMHPYQMTVSAETTPLYFFYGSGAIVDGSPSGGTQPVRLVKSGAGTLQFDDTIINTYTGSNIISGGIVLMGNNQSLGPSRITLSGGATLDVYPPRAMNLPNPMTFSGPASVGNGATAITLSGQIDFNGGTQSITNPVNLVFTGGATNGTWQKEGLGTITQQNCSYVGNGAIDIFDGSWIVTGSAATMTNTGAIRPVCKTEFGTARFVVTNGASVYLTANNANLRVGYNGNTNLNTTNIIDCAGILHLTGIVANNQGRLFLGNRCARAEFNLFRGGDLMINYIRNGDNATNNAYGVFNFNGGVLRSIMDMPTFMQGVSNVQVQAGGAYIDTTNHISIMQNLLNGGGGGGLVKLGIGTLNLDGTNTYTGLTIVSNGTLGGNGIIAGSLQVRPGATLAPGNSIGALTCGGSVTSDGTVLMELNTTNAGRTNDLLIASSITLNGVLTVVNNGPLSVGDSFDLFDGTLNLAGLTATNLPAGYGWNTSQLANGIITVTSVPVTTQPGFSLVSASGGNLNLSATNGPAGGQYRIMTSLDVAAPLSGWTPIYTNNFDGTGAFGPIPLPISLTETQRFFSISVP